ncbi:hypothetical protein D3C78_1611560 [compost metagenome]
MYKSFCSSSYPRASIPICALVGSRIRITIFSPQRVGRVLTRKSMDLALDIFILIRPSCGLRRSEISRAAITFRRAAMRVANWMGGLATSCSIPSVRKRTR